MNPNWRGEIMVGYVQSGLICEMIAEKHGLGAIRQMLVAYSTGQTTPQVIEQVMGQSTAAFDSDMTSWLEEWVKASGVGPSFQARHIDHLRELAEQKEDDASAWAWLAAAYFGAGRQADADLAMGKASRIDDQHADLLALKSWIQLKDGKIDSAIDSLRKAID